MSISARSALLALLRVTIGEWPFAAHRGGISQAGV
jgi:hypothetical protein